MHFSARLCNDSRHEPAIFKLFILAFLAFGERKNRYFHWACQEWAREMARKTGMLRSSRSLHKMLARVAAASPTYIHSPVPGLNSTVFLFFAMMQLFFLLFSWLMNFMTLKDEKADKRLSFVNHNTDAREISTHARHSKSLMFAQIIIKIICAFICCFFPLSAFIISLAFCGEKSHINDRSMCINVKISMPWPSQIIWYSSAVLLLGLLRVISTGISDMKICWICAWHSFTHLGLRWM